MCTTCGCPTDHRHDHDDRDHHDHHHHGDHHHHDHDDDHHHREKVAVAADLLAANDRLAALNRDLLRAAGAFSVNLVSSPGSGKTTILERTLRDLAGTCRFAVIEGDQQTDRDAVRIAATGAPAVQVNTGAGCHLDARMVGKALRSFELSGLDLLFIENVGNLVCPASFDLGEEHKVVVLSITEGEDKPLKYPLMFRAATVMLLTKIDLLPHVEFDVAACREMARRVNPDILILEVSAKSGAGMEAWYRWLRQEAAAATR